jgi:hypothetical protein
MNLIHAPFSAVARSGTDVLRRTSLAVLLALLAFSTALVAQEQSGTIQGRVTCKATGEPVFAAFITLAETNRRVRTDKNGDFVFDSVPVGRVQLLVAAIGYSPQRAVVDIRSDGPTVVEFALAEIVINRNRARSTGDRAFRAWLCQVEREGVPSRVPLRVGTGITPSDQSFGSGLPSPTLGDDHR